MPYPQYQLTDLGYEPGVKRFKRFDPDDIIFGIAYCQRCVGEKFDASLEFVAPQHFGATGNIPSWNDDIKDVG